jgi:(2R)-sulfolactate sulfo-lyase subunit alpha
VVVVEGLKAGQTPEWLDHGPGQDDRVRREERHPDRPQAGDQAIAKGDTIIKYGVDIGKAVADIGAGEHLHVHNVKTKRW